MEARDYTRAPERKHDVSREGSEKKGVILEAPLKLYMINIIHPAGGRQGQKEPRSKSEFKPGGAIIQKEIDFIAIVGINKSSRSPYFLDHCFYLVYVVSEGWAAHPFTV